MKLERQKLSSEDISLFSRQLALIADSDVSMQQGLAIIGERSGNKQIKRISVEVINGINKGVSFFNSVRKFEPQLGSFFVEMVGIGEKSGNMPIMLERIADSLDKQNETAQKIRSAVVYPVILAVLMLAVIVLLLVYVLPMFNDILVSMGGDMPGLTRGIMNFGIFISNNIWWLSAIIAAVILFFWVFKLTETGKEKLDSLKLKLPIFKKITTSNVAAGFARNLAMLLRSGINLTLSVEMLGSVINNRYIAKKIVLIVKELEKGLKPDEAFEKLDIFPWLIIKLFSVAHETGHMDSMLDRAADILERETDYRLEKLTTVIEPVLIIILSLLVGFILLSVILPVTGIMNAVG